MQLREFSLGTDQSETPLGSQECALHKDYVSNDKAIWALLPGLLRDDNFAPEKDEGCRTTSLSF